MDNPTLSIQSTPRRGFVDLAGRRFGRLTAVYPTERRYFNQVVWHCQCECGNTKEVYRQGLTTGAVISCGCGRNGGLIYKPGTRLHRTWSGMKHRCNNKKCPGYANYGGRGIYVHTEWNSYVPFHDWAITHGYREDLFIDRINNDGPYSPENCRWATRVEQANNKRCTTWLTFRGEVDSLSNHARAQGFKPCQVRLRLRAGWSTDDALTVPLEVHRARHSPADPRDDRLGAFPASAK